MERKYYTFAEAMNIVGNGGFVSRRDYSDKMCIGLHDDELVTEFSLHGEEPTFVDHFTPSMEEIKAEDWYLREDVKPRVIRTTDEIRFDEELLEIKKALEAMSDLSVDRRRCLIYCALMDILVKEGEINLEPQEECEEVQDIIAKAFAELESILNK